MPEYTGGPTPQAIADQVETEIRAGQPPPGECLPTQSDLAERFRVSRSTIYNMLPRLEERGLIERRRGGPARVLPAHRWRRV